MKHYKKLRLSTLVLLGLLTFSCQNEDDLIIEEPVKVETEVDTSKLIDFKGLPVNHRFSTPVEELEIEHDYETLKSMYNSKKNGFLTVAKSSLVNPTVEDLPDAEAIVTEAESHISEYPFGDSKTDEEKWEMIKNDFPTLTEKEISDNMDLIDQYYSQNLDYETIAGLASKTEVELEASKTFKTSSTNAGINDVI